MLPLLLYPLLGMSFFQIAQFRREHPTRILVIGAKNSSNSIRLVEVAQGAGRRGHLINQANEIDPRWFEGVRCVGVTSGASAPEHLVQEVVASLQRLGATRVEEWELVKEDVNFGLPLELTQLEAGSRKAEA